MSELSTLLLRLSVALGEDLTGSGQLSQLLDDAVSNSQQGLVALKTLHDEIRVLEQRHVAKDHRR